MRFFIILLLVTGIFVPPYYAFQRYQEDAIKQQEFDDNCANNHGIVIYTQHKDKICVRSDILVQ